MNANKKRTETTSKAARVHNVAALNVKTAVRCGSGNRSIQISSS